MGPSGFIRVEGGTFVDDNCNEFLLFGWNRSGHPSFPQCWASHSSLECVSRYLGLDHTVGQPACQCFEPNVVADRYSASPWQVPVHKDKLGCITSVLSFV